jgi:hypothetical protein
MIMEGDIILVDSTVFFSNKPFTVKVLDLMHKIDGGRATHAAIYCGNNKILHSNWHGVKMEDLSWMNPFEEDGTPKPNFSVLRLKGGVDKDKIIDFIMDYHLNHISTGYSYLGLISAGISAVIGAITFLISASTIRWKPVLLKEEKAPFCSELVAEIYEEYTGSKFSVPNDVMSPNDLYRANRFDKIIDFK